jgi:two-component system response regulator DesR
VLSADPAFDVIGTVTDGLQAPSLILKLQPDLVVIDISMRGCGGLDCIREVRRTLPGQLFLILTTHYGLEDLVAAFQLGVQGFLVKSDPISHVITAMKGVAAGAFTLSRPVISIVIEEFERIPAFWEQIPETEKRVLYLTQDGLDIEEIAERLVMTVEHVNYFLQLFLSSLRTQAANNQQLKTNN